MKKSDWDKALTSMKETLEPPPRSERKNQSRSLVKDFASGEPIIPLGIPVPTEPILSQPNPSQRSPTSPSRDYNKRANSLERDALPRGLFPGTSKKLYDSLYLRTRGAITPTRVVQATKRELMAWSGIKSKNTIAINLQLLTSVGLIKKEIDIGDHDGSTYEVFLPDELPSPTQHYSSQPIPTQKLGDDPTQKLGWVGMSNVVDSKETNDLAKTSSKTTTNDDEALTELVQVLKDLSHKLTGKSLQGADIGRWRELATVISAEAERAASHTNVSNLPAFLTEHLRRRLSREEKPAKMVKKDEVGKAAKPAEKPMTDEERSEVVQMIISMISGGGYTIEQAEAQFGTGLRPEDWAEIRAQVAENGSTTN